MRIIFENNHVPAIGKYKDAVVEDQATSRRYIYDCCGTYVSLSVEDGYYKFNFTNDTSIEIEHNLNRYPSVTVVDSGGDMVLPGNVHYDDVNNLTVTLSIQTTGIVLLKSEEN